MTQPTRISIHKTVAVRRNVFVEVAWRLSGAWGPACSASVDLTRSSWRDFGPGRMKTGRYESGFERADSIRAGVERNREMGGCRRADCC